MQIDSLFLERCIVKASLLDKNFAALLSSTFIPAYFDSKDAANVFSFITSHLATYNNLPDKEIIEHSVAGSADYLLELDDMPLETIADQNWLMENANNYLKDKAIKQAILDSATIIEQHGNLSDIRHVVEEALCKDLKIDLGLNYLQDLGSRLKNILDSNDARIPTYYPLLDEYLNGGYPRRGMLGCLSGSTFGGKTQCSINLGARQALHGHTVVIFTMEIDEYSYAMRADGIYSGLDANRLYIDKKSIRKLIQELRPLKDSGFGNLIIKDYPTGHATVNDLIVFIRELQMRGVNPDVVYVDYIGVMKGKYPTNSYLSIKTLAEELRAMSIMFGIPVVTFSQINREGSRLPFSELKLGYTAESSALEHTVDFMGLIGIDEESIVYQSTLYIKLVKNRLGGRKGTIPFYMDMKSLKIYAENEIDTWLADAAKSGDTRELFNK